ncbi:MULTISPECIES: hypothetical protein [unclassified Bradyrhizobium]|uniref:hypothetical protein n=1 Tax=unclassified Bradyrhizobium TaxID=2631580 RepID=UPI0028E85631|nr:MULTISPECIES: hypothetical protein [unclassified Bradyrhizobium]
MTRYAKAVRYLISGIVTGLLLHGTGSPASAQPFDVPALPLMLPPMQIMPVPLPDIMTPLLLQQQQDLLQQQITAQQAQQFAIWAEQSGEWVLQQLQQAEQHSDRSWTQLGVLEADEAAGIARIIQSRSKLRGGGAQPSPLEPIVPSFAPERDRPPTRTEWFNTAWEADRVSAEARKFSEEAMREAHRAMETARSLREHGMNDAALRQLETSTRLDEHARFQRDIAQRTRDLAREARELARTPALAPIVSQPRSEIVFPRNYQPSLAAPIPSAGFRH